MENHFRIYKIYALLNYYTVEILCFKAEKKPKHWAMFKKSEKCCIFRRQYKIRKYLVARKLFLFYLYRFVNTRVQFFLYNSLRHCICKYKNTKQYLHHYL